jgi:uncharacterized membrane protein
MEDAMPVHQHDIREMTEAEISETAGGAKGSDAKSFWTLLGTIFGGPPIGTSIGTAIGQSTGDDDADA